MWDPRVLSRRYVPCPVPVRFLPLGPVCRSLTAPLSQGGMYGSVDGHRRRTAAAAAASADELAGLISEVSVQRAVLATLE